MSSIRSTYRQILSDYPGEKVNFIKCIIARFLNPSYNVLFNYRIGYYFYHSKNRFLHTLGSRKRMKLIFKKNCDISFLSQIGHRIRFPHPIGIVIGAGVKIGNNVTIFQNVTLGSHGKSEKQKEYPTIEDNVIIYAGSIIVGNVKIGKNSVVGAKTLVNIDVPPNSLVIGSPCKIVSK